MVHALENEPFPVNDQVQNRYNIPDKGLSHVPLKFGETLRHIEL